MNITIGNITMNNYSDFKNLPLKSKFKVIFMLFMVPLALLLTFAGIIIAIGMAIGVILFIIPIILIAILITVIKTTSKK